MDDTTRQRIQHTLDHNRVVLFMKGTRMFPQCGFSAQVVNILKKLNVTFQDVNVLTDDAVRQGIKEFSTWPTIPQLYIDKKFIGGCDIVTDLFDSGELERMVAPKAS